MSTTINDVMRAGRRGGAAKTQVAKTLLLGTRPRQKLSASNAPAQRSALGVGPRSVYTGPNYARGGMPGAPILRRL